MKKDNDTFAVAAGCLAIAIGMVGMFFFGFKAGQMDGEHDARQYKEMAETALRKQVAYDRAATLILKNWQPNLSWDEITSDVEELEKKLEPTCHATVGILQPHDLGDGRVEYKIRSKGEKK